LSSRPAGGFAVGLVSSPELIITPYPHPTKAYYPVYTNSRLVRSFPPFGNS
jgi:hypothetical protein